MWSRKLLRVMGTDTDIKMRKRMKHDHRSRNERGRKRVLGHCRPWFGVIQVYHEQNFFFVLKLVQLESYHDPKMLTNRERKSINVR